MHRKSISPTRKFGQTAKTFFLDSSLNDRDDIGFQAFDLSGRKIVKKGWAVKEPYDIDAGLSDPYTFERN